VFYAPALPADRQGSERFRPLILIEKLKVRDFAKARERRMCFAAGAKQRPVLAGKKKKRLDPYL